MKIVIAGAKGLVGKALTDYLRVRAGYEVVPLSRADLDISDPEAMRRVLAHLQPTMLINAAGFVSVDGCEANPKLAYAVNCDAVSSLLETCDSLPTPPIFVQISSSAVFGDPPGGHYRIDGYSEHDERYPVSVYQKSKAQAEDIALAFAGARSRRLTRWYIVRASWLFGEGRDTFVELVIDALRARKELTVALDRWNSPTWTVEFSRGLADLIAGGYPNGIYHIVSQVKPGEATMIDVIDEVRAYLAVPKDQVNVRCVARRDLFRAPRAPSNVLRNTKLPQLRYWRESLRQYLTLRYPNGSSDNPANRST